MCVAFSGGVDSSLLLKLALTEAKRHGTAVYAVTFDTQLHPICDIQIAREVAGQMGARHQVIEVDELANPEILKNPVNRCYLCKKNCLENSWRLLRVKISGACWKDQPGR